MDINKQNIKAVKNIFEYAEKISISLLSLHTIFKQFHDDMYVLQNDLNFRSVTEQFIDTYNRYISFLYEQIKGVLSISFITESAKEILLIKPVRDNKYEQELELTYFANNIIVTKPLGSVATMSIIKINDEILFLRGNRKYTFIEFELNSIISKNDLKDHLESYIKQTKDIIGWIYSDIKAICMMIKSFGGIISEISKFTPKKYYDSWIELLENIKKTVEEMNTGLI